MDNVERYDEITKRQLPVKTIGLIGTLAIMCLLLSFYLAHSRSLELSGADKIFFQRDFSQTPFGLMDAYDACLLEAQSKLGAGMLRMEWLPLSTRYNADKNTYKVVLDVDVGTVREWSDAHIYCDVDPDEQEISYYKEIYQGEPSILAKTMNILSDLMK